MLYRRYTPILPLLFLLSACSSQPKTTSAASGSETQAGGLVAAPKGGFLMTPQHNQSRLGGDFALNPEAEKFIDKMVK